MMNVHLNQKRFIDPIWFYQQFLKKIFPQNDPFLQEFNNVAALVLDDHPYPKTQKEFNRRTQQIIRNIRKLHLSSSDQKFLNRLMIETGVSVVCKLFFSKY